MISREIERRPQHPRPQQALAHGRDRGIDRAKQRHARIRPGEQRLNQFQIADRDRIEHQAILPLIPADAVHVVERSALRGAHIIENRAGGRRRRGASGQAESLQRQHAEMIFQQRNRMVGSENPVVERSFRRTCSAQMREAGR